MLCTYTGSDSRMYLDYRDAFTGRSLEAAPGGTYDIEVASGQPGSLPLPPGDGRWLAAAEGVPGAPAAPPWPPAPVPAAEPEPVAPVTPEEAGDRPADEES